MIYSRLIINKINFINVLIYFNSNIYIYISHLHCTIGKKLIDKLEITHELFRRKRLMGRPTYKPTRLSLYT